MLKEDWKGFAKTMEQCGAVLGVKVERNLLNAYWSVLKDLSLQDSLLAELAGYCVQREF